MTIKNLVFEGGGVKGIAHIGALKYMEEQHLLDNVENVIGSSVGSIIATGIAIGLTVDELQKVIESMDFKKFADRDRGFLRNMYRFIYNGGVYKGDALERWIGDLLEKYCDKRNITFKEMYEKYGKLLVITGTNIDKMRTLYFNKYNSPNMMVRKAIRISSSFPYLFKYVKYNGDTYVDGGLLDNYPFSYFHDYENTVGIKFINDDNVKDDIIYYTDREVNNVVKLSMNIVQSMLYQIERAHVHGKYWDNTIAINTGTISSMNFNLKEEDKTYLYNSGYNCAKMFFDNKDIELVILDDNSKDDSNPHKELPPIDGEINGNGDYNI